MTNLLIAVIRTCIKIQLFWTIKVRHQNKDVVRTKLAFFLKDLPDNETFYELKNYLMTLPMLRAD